MDEIFQQTAIGKKTSQEVDFGPVEFASRGSRLGPAEERK